MGESGTRLSTSKKQLYSIFVTLFQIFNSLRWPFNEDSSANLYIGMEIISVPIIDNYFEHRESVAGIH